MKREKRIQVVWPRNQYIDKACRQDLNHHLSTLIGSCQMYVSLANKRDIQNTIRRFSFIVKGLFSFTTNLSTKKVSEKMNSSPRTKLGGQL